MQAILTKYLGPTNNKGSRIKASCDAGSINIPYPYEFDIADAHKFAARQLTEKLKWKSECYGELITGQLPCGDYCHVFAISK